MHGLKTIVRLSLLDYSHERLLSACTILGMAAVLAPLLVLFGVKSGIINTMVDRLIQDPRNLEISPVGSGRYDQDWFAAAAKHPGVAFIIPQTRSIAANMILYHKIKGKPRTLAVDLIPTGTGDPLIEKWGKVPAENNAIVLSASVARKLKVSTGQQIVGRVGRSVQGRKEQVAIDLKVISILPIEAYPRDAAFVRLTLLEATEDYRDGFSSKIFGWPGKSRPSRPKEYPSFRLYAQSIYDVAALRDWLTAQELEIYTRVEEIGSRLGVKIICFGHAGDGNIHVNVMYDKTSEEQEKAAEKAVREIFTNALEMKGTLSGEHGIGVTKSAYIGMEIEPAELALMKRIKLAFDPDNILNPGKIFSQ